MSFPALVSSDWLAAHLDDASVRVLDGSYHLPTAKRDAAAEFLAAHIPGAAFFDIEAISDQSSALPHMLPTTEAFAAAAGALGIDADTHVVVYDAYGLMSAARVWWMLRVFGHDRVSVLDGGFPKWRNDGHPVEAGAARNASRRFSATFRPELVRAKGDLVANLEAPAFQVVDARSNARFLAQAPEPRAGLRGGHIPGSASLPYTALLDPATQALLPPEAIAKIFAEAGLDMGQPIVASCGSGVTACVLALGLYTLGHANTPVYDGSWSEWGLPDGPPVATNA
ncbi:MAG: 3-mercaptopyruvate sulfurtransferase [Magnetospirillum sp.]|jgi:thiosulfate/3-mercaptopyruvate sulfurtransferase|nr:3-mercaptopyruvate sulfurtransferase [Magnetospirillum sp.]